MPGLHIGWNYPNPSCVCMYIRMCKCEKKLFFLVTVIPQIIVNVTGISLFTLYFEEQ